MATPQISPILRVALVIAAIELFIYGLLLFLIPGPFMDLVHARAGDLFLVRWPGGTLISLGVGAWLTFRAPSHRGLFVRVLTLGYGLTAIAMAWSWAAGQSSADTVQIALPTVLNAVVCVLLFLGWRSSQSVLE